MLYAQARLHARRGPDGDYVPLAEQDVALWDDGLIAEAEALLLRASRLNAPGRYQLEAAVQSAHSLRRHGQAPDHAAILQLYDALATLTPSPVAALNRAVALAEVEGPQAALAACDALAAEPRLQGLSPGCPCQKIDSMRLPRQAGRPRVPPGDREISGRQA